MKCRYLLFEGFTFPGTIQLDKLFILTLKPSPGIDWNWHIPEGFQQSEPSGEGVAAIKGNQWLSLWELEYKYNLAIL